MLAANRVITIVHYNGEGYESCVIEGVSVHQRVERSVQELGVVVALVARVQPAA